MPGGVGICTKTEQAGVPFLGDRKRVEKMGGLGRIEALWNGVIPQWGLPERRLQSAETSDSALSHNSKLSLATFAHSAD